MDRFWKIFWIAFGIITVGALAASVVAGIVTQSVETTYDLAQKTLAGALGVSGVIGLTVPIGLYFDDRKQRRENHVVE